MASVEDVCLICTEPLRYVSVLACGHADMCSQCCLRLRLIVQDTKCPVCQRESANVLLTRHEGAFTAKLPTNERDLKGLHRMKGIDGIHFDDIEHRNECASKCALSCSVCTSSHGGQMEDDDDDDGNASGGGDKKKKKAKRGRGGFASIKALKAHLKESHGLFLCDVCLEGRKVFIREQVLYTKSELSRHYSKGDIKGAMAEAGFKGYPSCQFCKKYFYSDQELYSHMQTKHLTCFICRRSNPTKYTYYRNIADLTRHFESSHEFCMHESCLERHPEERVFESHEDLRVHCVKQHGEALSKQQKKQALLINVKYPSLREREAAAVGGSGGSNASVSSSQQNAGANNAGRSRSSGAGAGAVAAAPEDMRDVFAGVDQSQQPWRKAIGGSGGASFSEGSQWPGLTPSSSSSSSYAHSDSSWGHSYQPTEYPSLPGASKSSKKRAKAKAAAAAAVPASDSSATAWGSRSEVSNRSTAKVNEELRSKNRALMQKLRQELDHVVFAAFRQESAKFLQGEVTAAHYYQRVKSLGLVEYARELGELCPMEDKRDMLLQLVDQDVQEAPKRRLDKRDESQKYVNLASLLRQNQIRDSGQSSSGRAVGASRVAAVPPPSILQPTASATVVDRSIREAGQAQAGPSSKPKEHSVEVKQSNRKLMEKLRQELDDDTFMGFRMKSAEFLNDKASPEEYYHLIVGLGLADLISNLANLCPDASKRNALLNLHKNALAAESQYRSQQDAAARPKQQQQQSSKASRKKKHGKFERLRLGDGIFDDSTSSSSNSNGGPRKNQFNSWSQGQGRGLF